MEQNTKEANGSSYKMYGGPFDGQTIQSIIIGGKIILRLSQKWNDDHPTPGSRVGHAIYEPDQTRTGIAHWLENTWHGKFIGLDPDGSLVEPNDQSDKYAPSSTEYSVDQVEYMDDEDYYIVMKSQQMKNMEDTPMDHNDNPHNEINPDDEDLDETFRL